MSGIRDDEVTGTISKNKISGQGRWVPFLRAVEAKRYGDKANYFHYSKSKVIDYYHCLCYNYYNGGVLL